MSNSNLWLWLPLDEAEAKALHTILRKLLDRQKLGPKAVLVLTPVIESLQSGVDEFEQKLAEINKAQEERSTASNGLKIGQARQQMILEALQKNAGRSLTVKEIANLTGVDNLAVNKNLRYLLKRGKVERSDDRPKKSGFLWTLKPIGDRHDTSAG